MTLRDLLDPDVATATDIIPFDEMTADILTTLRTMPPVELPLSDAVERTDHLVPGDPEVPVRVHRAKAPRARCRASTRCTVAAT